MFMQKLLSFTNKLFNFVLWKCSFFLQFEGVSYSCKVYLIWLNVSKTTIQNVNQSTKVTNLSLK